MKVMPEMLDSVVLDNNGLKDKVDENGSIDNSLNILIDGFNYLTCLRKFVCKNNNFSTKCLFSMRKILERKSPN